MQHRRTMLALAATIVSSTFIAPAVAGAESTNWKYGFLGAGARDADVTRTALQASGANADGSNHKIQAGAHYPGGWDLFDVYAEGWGTACHNYASRNLGAMVRNPHTVDQLPVGAVAGWRGSYNTFC